MSLQDYRKLFVDTVVTTTHFLKKCVKVPKIDEMPLDDPTLGYTKKEKARILEEQARRAFQRGAMNFEDYNYE